MDKSIDDYYADLFAKTLNIDSLSSEGLRGEVFPDNLIAQVNNRLGNIRQFLSGIDNVFNASEQSIMYKNSANELDELINDLYNLRHGEVITSGEFSSLNNSAMEFKEALKKYSDVDYF